MQSKILMSVCASTLLLIGIMLPPMATASSPAPADMQTGTLLLRMSQGYQTATLLNTDVNIHVNGLVARVSAMQKFQNTSSEWVEGVYVFPLPEAAAVDHMRLYIGERFIEGEIREKEQARKEYEAAKQAGKKTSLVARQRAAEAHERFLESKEKTCIDCHKGIAHQLPAVAGVQN